MKSFVRRLIVAAAYCGWLAGCGPAGEERPPAPDAGLPPPRDDSAGVRQPPATPGSDDEQRPGTRQIAISIEGTQDTIEARLVRAPADFTLRFSTYVPEDMSPALERSEAGEALRVTAEFGGVRNEQAYIEVLIHPPGTARDGALDALRAFLRALHPDIEIQEQADRYSWAEAAFSFRYPDGGGSSFIGSAALGRHGDRWFRLLRNYPGDYGDGMGPRVGVILEGWRWADGSRL